MPTVFIPPHFKRAVCGCSCSLRVGRTLAVPFAAAGVLMMISMIVVVASLIVSFVVSIVVVSVVVVSVVVMLGLSDERARHRPRRGPNVCLADAPP
jgi:hypothetical protein